MNELITNNSKFIEQISKAINTECNAKYIIKWINKWKKDYKKQGYTFTTRENIYKTIIKILNKVI